MPASWIARAAKRKFVAQVSALAFTLEKEVKTMAPKDHATLIARIGVAYTQSCAEIDAHPLTVPARH